MARIWMGVVAAGVLMGAAAAQAPGGSAAAGPAGEVQGSYGRVKGFLVKAAEKMPADQYGSKPTNDVRTFARVVNHVTEAQVHSCGAVNGTATTAMMKVPPETANKDQIVEALKASFAECDKAYGATTDANATEMLAMGQGKRSRLGILWGNVSHDNEQYATLALYLRLKGLEPPSSEK